MLFDYPSYYKNSKVMHDILDSLESEYIRLKEATQLTEDAFFVLLSDYTISRHELDVGLPVDEETDLETRRSKILSRLRGTGTVTKTMIKNVANSFVNGEIEVIEYADKYMFAIKFISKKGVPYNLNDIKSVIEEIKPAHLALEIIFTYRLWQDVLEKLSDWQTVRQNTWDWLLTFEIKFNLNILNGKVYYCPEENGNAFIVYNDGKAYGRGSLENG